MKEKNWLDYLDAVNDFSLSKGEPDWMRTFRQDALAKADELPLPHIDRVKFHRWSLFDVKETQTISETGTIPAFDAMKDNPVLVQQGSWTIFEQLPVELAEKGVFYRLVHCNDRISRTSPRILYEKSSKHERRPIDCTPCSFYEQRYFPVCA